MEKILYSPGKLTVIALKNAAIFLFLLALSLFLFPFLALPVAYTGIPHVSDFLLFWPQLVLLPNGFINYANDFQYPIFMETALYGSAIFWFFSSAAYGYFLRNVRHTIVAIAALPVAGLFVIFFYLILGLLGYSAYLDGP